MILVNIIYIKKYTKHNVGVKLDLRVSGIEDNRKGKVFISRVYEKQYW